MYTRLSNPVMYEFYHDSLITSRKAYAEAELELAEAKRLGLDTTEIIERMARLHDRIIAAAYSIGE